MGVCTSVCKCVSVCLFKMQAAASVLRTTSAKILGITPGRNQKSNQQIATIIIKHVANKKKKNEKYTTRRQTKFPFVPFSSLTNAKGYKSLRKIVSAKDSGKFK